ncbi:class I SAM-dependent methyltransferase [Orbaceae bacterium ESL0721]|nr:class I SAM-dependent methyltransferase [Orbaceae bacterium ESL0721]
MFPNGVLPSIAQLSRATEGKFIMEDWQNFGPDYDKTLMAWHENLMRNKPELQKHYSKEELRMFTYYLLCCAGTFRARTTQLWQVVFSKKRKERYDAPR